MHAVLDDQANKSLAKKELFDLFDPNCPSEEYDLKTCSGSTSETGRRSHGFIVESLDQKTRLNLPTLIECDTIPAKPSRDSYQRRSGISSSYGRYR